MEVEQSVFDRELGLSCPVKEILYTCRCMCAIQIGTKWACGGSHPPSILTGPSERLTASLEHGHRHGAECWKYSLTDTLLRGKAQAEDLYKLHPHPSTTTKNKVARNQNQTETKHLIYNCVPITYNANRNCDASQFLFREKSKLKPSLACSKCVPSGSSFIIMIHVSANSHAHISRFPIAARVGKCGSVHALCICKMVQMLVAGNV